MSDATHVWRAAGVMSVGTAISRLTGLARTAAMIYALGVSGARLADTYNLANTTPNIVYELFLGGILTAVFLPVLIDVREKRSGDPSALVSVSLIALALISALTAIGAPLVMRIYTFRIADPVVRAQQLELASFLLRWFAPQIFFYGVSAIGAAMMNLRGRFGPATFAPVLNNLVVIATMVLYAHYIGKHTLHIGSAGTILLGAGTTAGVIVQAVVLLPYLRGERLRFRPDVSDPAVAHVMRLAAYVIGYVIVNQIGLWVVLVLANRIAGGVTAFTYAFQFFIFPHSLFAVSLQTALFPDLSRAAGGEAWDTFRRWFATGVRGLAYLMFPAAIGYGLLAYPICRLLVHHGAASAHDANAVAAVLQAMATGLVFFSAFQLLTRCFYALPDTRTPTALNAVAVAVNIAIDLPLFLWLGVAGLGLGQTISYAIGSLVLVVALRRRVPGGLHLAVLVGPLLRIVVASGAMGVCVWIVTRVVPGGDLAVVGASVGAGAILYLAFSQVAGVDEGSLVVGLLHRRTQGDVT